MTKPRDKITILERHGFRDDDIKTPDHDAIMVWLDLAVHSLFSEHLRRQFHEDPNDVTVSRKWEVPIHSDSTNRFCIGFIDMVATFRIGHEVAKVYFEVKTSIKSIGELFRQLNTYIPHIDGPIFVVCPDGKWKDLIESQGFGFIKCDMDEVADENR